MDEALRQEFLEQFREAATDRLTKCRDQIRLATVRPADVDRTDAVRARAEVLRELHALKGEARMMGAEDVAGAIEAAEHYLKQRNAPIESVAEQLLTRTFDATDRLVAFTCGRIDRSPKTELNTLLRLLSRAPEPAYDPDATEMIDASSSEALRQQAGIAATQPSDVTPARGLPTAQPRVSREKYPLLLIDDSEIAREVTANAIREAGYPVRATDSLRDALRLVAEQRPQLILCDYHLAETTGDEVVRELRGDLATAAIPIVLYSAMESRDLAGIAKTVGAAGALAKPSDMAEWILDLDRMIARVLPRL